MNLYTRFCSTAGLLLSITFFCTAQQPAGTQPSGEGTGSDPFRIASVEDLIWIAECVNAGDDLSNRFFKLTKDLDLTASKTWNEGKGWTPVGGYIFVDGLQKKVGFGGSLDGDGHVIDNLYINRPEENYQGLFGYTKGSVKNLTLKNPQIRGNEYVGALAAYLFEAPISNCHIFAGAVTASHIYAGGLVGYAAWGTMTGCSADCSVTGVDYVGGITSWNNEGTIDFCASSGKIIGANSLIGGLVGYQYYGKLANSYSTAFVKGVEFAGGAVGKSNQTTVENCSAAGDVEGRSNIGGFIGRNEAAVTTNCFARGNVKGEEFVGGFAGYNSYEAGRIVNCYSTGKAEGEIPFTGGFVGGLTGGHVVNSYWDITTSATDKGVGGVSFDQVECTGKTTAEMKQWETFKGWDRTNVWVIDPAINDGYPALRGCATAESAKIEPDEVFPQLQRLDREIFITNIEAVRDICMYNTAGIPIMRLKTRGFRGSFRIPTEGLTPGLYPIRCRLNDGRICVLKLLY